MKKTIAFTPYAEHFLTNTRTEPGDTHRIQVPCICGRSAAAIMTPGSPNTPHGQESTADHAVEQMTTGQGESIPFLFIATAFIPIKIFLDYTTLKKIPGLIKHYRETKKCLARTPNSVLTSYLRTKQETHKETLWMSAWNLLVASPLFYCGAISYTIANGLAIQGIANGIAASLGGFAFGGLGGVIALEGLWQLRRTLGLPPVAAQTEFPDTNTETYRKFVCYVEKSLRKKQLTATTKVVGGLLTLLGFALPGAQPAMIVGMGLIMLPAAQAAYQWLRHQLWSFHTHAHGTPLDEVGTALRMSHAQEKITLLEAATDLTKALRDKTCTLQSAVETFGNRVTETTQAQLEKQIRLLTEMLEQAPDAPILAEQKALLEAQQKKWSCSGEQSLEAHASACRTHNPIYTQLMEALVVPQSRGPLKRWWGYRSIQNRITQGLIIKKNTPRWWQHQEFACAEHQDFDTVLNKLMENPTKLTKKITAVMKHWRHDAQHELEHIASCENQYRYALSIKKTPKPS